MSLVLLVGDNAKALDLFSLNLEMYVGSEVLCKASFKEAIELLKVLPKLDLIVTFDKVGNEETAVLIDQFISDNKKSIPLIVFGDETQLRADAHFLQNSKEVQPLIKTAASILGVDAKSMMSQVVPEYYPIDINYFNCLTETFCTIFEKNGNEYEIIFLDKNPVDHAEINKRVTEGIVSLYVSKKYRLKFVAEISQAILGQLSDATTTPEQRSKSTDVTINIVKDKIGMEVDGLSEEVIELASAAIESLSTVVEQAPSLKKLLSMLLNNQSSFLYKHSQLITYLCFHAIDNMEWGTDEQKSKMAFISFFHDIALTRDELATIESEDQLKDARISKEDKDRVSKHALAAANLIKDYPKAPIGADTIIKQHHGSRSGIGFAEHYGDNISPLAIVFIVCESFAMEILGKEGEIINVTEEVQKLHYKFTSEKYSNVLRALSNLEIG